MIKTLLLFISGCLLLPFCSNAQFFIYDSTIGRIDSTTFTLKTGDSLNHQIITAGWGLGVTGTVIDTGGTGLWEIGNTHKPGFATGTAASHGIMTDTLNPYPHNANAYFVLKVGNMVTNLLIEVWHEYQTDSSHAGGAIEFSTDSGLTWVNTANCYLPSQNMPTNADTLLSGEPAFTGNSFGQLVSKFQFFNCVGVKTTNTSCSFGMSSYMSMFIRFRFISDSVTSTMPGWKIDSIRVVNPGCVPGFVKDTKLQQPFTPYPNPSFNGLFNLPEIKDAQDYTLEVYNAMGQRLMVTTYQNTLDMKGLPKGVYFFRASNGQQEYSCNLLLE